MAKQRANLDEFVHDLFSQIVTELPLSSQVTEQKRDRVTNELLYLSIFLIDLGVYFAMNESPQRRLVMDGFWDLVNASGLNMDFLQGRMQAYTESAKSETRDEAFVRLGKTFAWHCLAQGDDDVATTGRAEAKRILESVVQLTSSTQITM